jgi:hypothetical protein
MAHQLMLSFTFLIEAEHGQTPPQVRAGSHNFLLPVGQSTIDIAVPDEQSLILDFYSKSESDTVIKDGQIVADTQFKILTAWCDGILLENWFNNITVYRPNYFKGFLQHCPDAPAEIISPYQFNFPGTISWSWQDNFWDWYFEKKNSHEVINFIDQDPDRAWKFRGSLDPCEDLVSQIKQVLEL